MKQCKNCGAWAQPNDAFCLTCGAPMGDAVSPIARVKKACGSPLLLIAAALLTLNLIANIASIVMTWVNGPMAMLNTLRQLTLQMGVNMFSYGDMDFWMILVGLIQVLSLIVPVLTVVGLWMFYASCKKKPVDAPAKTGGLGMLKVGPILSVIGTIFALVVGGILTLILFIGALSTGESEALIAAILGLLGCGVLVMMMLYYFGVMRTISAVAYAAKNGKRYQKVSMYVIVWNFVILLVNLVSVGTNVLVMNFIGAGTQLFYTVAIFLLVISTILYRSKVQKTLEPAFPKAGEVPAYQPAPQPQFVPAQAPAQPYQQYAAPQYNAPTQPFNAPQQMNNPYNQSPVYDQYNAQPAYQPQPEAQPLYQPEVQPQPEAQPMYQPEVQPQNEIDFDPFAEAVQPEAPVEPNGPEIPNE